jgi:serine/threonine protein kinase
MIGSMVGSYKVTEKIGEGGMGAVFRGIDVMLEREVAIKMLRPELSQQPNLVERFRSEAVTLAKLNHPNIATLYSFLRQGDDFFMVMEFVRGETLDSVIGRTGAMNVQQGTNLFCQALEGIDHAHKMGIVHRDVKPANIMLASTGSIKVMDFGIARVLGTNRMTRTGHLIGTIEYMSPEQVRGEETDARSDIYSLGILLYEMLTGHLPFSASSEYELMRSQIEDAPRPPTELAPHIPLPVEQAVMRALAKRPEARFQSAGEFRALLGQSIGFSTNPGVVPSPGFVTPSTRLGEVPAGVPLRSPGAAKTLSTGSAVPPVPSPLPPRAIPSAAGLKETRLDSGGAHQMRRSPRYQAPESYHSTEPSQDGKPAKASFFSKLSWKLYAGVGAVVVCLVAITLVLLTGGNEKETTTPGSQSNAPGAVQPSASGAGARDLPGPPTRTGPLPSDTAPGGKSARSRNGSTTGVVETGDSQVGKQGEQPTDGKDPALSSSSTNTNAAHTPQAKGSSPSEKDPAKTAEPDKSKDPGTLSKIGGAMKKIGGLFGNKKKKDEKKP